MMQHVECRSEAKAVVSAEMDSERLWMSLLVLRCRCDASARETVHRAVTQIERWCCLRREGCAKGTYTVKPL